MKKVDGRLTAASGVLLFGVASWVFPREAEAIAGPRALPALAVAALGLAIWLSGAWPVIRALTLVLGATILFGWNVASTTSTSHVAGLCFGLLVMVLVGSFAQTERRLVHAVFGFLGAGLLTLVLGLAGATARESSPLDAMLPVRYPAVELGLAGLQGGIVNANALAAAVLLVAPLGVCLLIFGRGATAAGRGLVPAGTVVAAVGVLTLAICNSRTAWIAIWLTLIGLLVAGVAGARSRILIGALLVAPIFAGVGFVASLSDDTFLQRSRGIWQSTQDRMQVLEQGVEQFRTAPWFGIGVNEFRKVYRPNPSAAAHAHNMFLQTALDVGLVGSVAYWAILAVLLSRARVIARGAASLGRTAAIGSALALVAVTLFGLADAVPLGAKIGTFQWMAGGFILAASGMHHRDRAPEHVPHTLPPRGPE